METMCQLPAGPAGGRWVRFPCWVVRPQGEGFKVATISLQVLRTSSAPPPPSRRAGSLELFLQMFLQALTPPVPLQTGGPLCVAEPLRRLRLYRGTVSRLSPGCAAALRAPAQQPQQPTRQQGGPPRRPGAMKSIRCKRRIRSRFMKMCS